MFTFYNNTYPKKLVRHSSNKTVNNIFFFSWFSSGVICAGFHNQATLPTGEGVKCKENDQDEIKFNKKMIEIHPGIIVLFFIYQVPI